MKVLFREVEISTEARQQLVDVTEHVERIVRDSGIENGMCLIHSVHSTTSIIINEHENGLMDDILRKITADYPRGAGWRHDRIDDNADAHLASVFTGPSKTLPVRMGKLLRGTWQCIFLLELDGPRKGRRIVVEVMGE